VASSGDYIYTSTDSGVTWIQQTLSGSRNWKLITSSADGTKLVAATSGGYFYTSIDSGATWTVQTGTGERNWSSITSSSDGTKLAAVASGGSVWTSLDSGVTWTAQTGAGARSWTSITSSSDGTKLAAGVFLGSLWTSLDSGVTWIEQTGAGTQQWSSIASNSAGSKLAANADDSERIYTFSSETLYVSGLASGASATLTQTTTRVGYTSGSGSVTGTAIDGAALNPSFGSITSNANGFSVLINNYDSNYTWATPTVTAGSVSTTLGINWSTRSNSSGNRSWRSITSSSDGTKLAAVVAVGYIYTSVDSGATWTEQRSAGARSWRWITSSSDGTKLAAVVAAGGYIYTSADSGATWSERTNAGDRTWRTISSSSDGTKLAAAVAGGYIYTSTDSGATWTEQTGSGSRDWWHVTTSGDGTKLAAAADQGYIYTSTDSGATWTAQLASGSRGWRSITSSSDGTKLAAAADRGYIYTSTDSGATWTAQTGSGTGYWWHITSSGDGTKLTAVQNSDYIYTSTDSGVTWSQQTGAGDRGWRSVASSSDGTKLAVAADRDYIYAWTPTFLSVSGLTSGSSAAITQTTSRVGYTSGSATVAGSALVGSAPDQAEVVAAAKREIEKQEARADITSKLQSAKELSVELFAKAGIPGITPGNIAAVQAELLGLPESSRTDINQVLKVARKYEVVGNIGSGKVANMQSNSFIEIGLIPATSKNKVALVAAVRKLPVSDRDTYAEIKAAIEAASKEIQARKDRLTAIMSRIASKNSG
jgi:photosystem II stability/assembly factor-like uncharacterized protein